MTVTSVENRASFFARIAFFSPRDRFFVRKMYDLMKATHKDQVRKEMVGGKPVPYREHPRRVAIFIIDVLNITRPRPLVLALGHDVFEDAHENADVTPEYVEYLFESEGGEEVVRRLLLLTKPKPSPDGSDKIRVKAMYLSRLWKFADVETLIVKGADRYDNLCSLCHDGTTVEFIAKQCAETRTDYMPLFEHMEAKARGTEFHDAALKLLGLLREQLTRCETYLEQLRAVTPPTRPAADPLGAAPAGEDDAVCADRD
jgi:(p)ppGpp synthase/HD superfamily hydrolase